MKKRKTVSRYALFTVIFALAILFVIKFGGAPLLRAYIRAGSGSCEAIPILCQGPKEEIIRSDADIDKGYIAGLLPYRFPKMSLFLPKGFNVTQEEIRKIYYKKKKGQHNQAAVYLLYEEPDFFINLFPQLRKQGINDNYQFIARVMSARLSQVNGITDAFFVVMKGIFTPDLHDQGNVTMARFSLSAQKGFLNYNLSGAGNYFDANVITPDGAFVKIYIQDKGARLDLDKVLAIISTVEGVN